MSEPLDCEKILVRHLEQIRRAVRLLCLSSGFDDTDAEDCYSWVLEKLMKDDYAILRKFEGRSSIKTYLATVVARLARDWRTERWGRWRASAQAKRLGELACTLERLVYRDGLTLAQAMEVIRTRKGADAPSLRELTALFARIPRRGPLRPRRVDESELHSAESADSADRAVEQEDHDAEWSRIDTAIDAAIDRLKPIDAMVARMLLRDGMTVAEIARAQVIDQKPLYRRVKQIMEQLRVELRRLRFPPDRIRDFLDGWDR